MFLSWTYYQLADADKVQKFYMMQAFSSENMLKYFDFQLDQCGKDKVTQGSYFRNMFDCFNYVCNRLLTWIPTLNIRQSDRDYYLHINASSLQWLKGYITQVNFKEKIWTSMSKRAEYLNQHDLTLTKQELQVVEEYTKRAIILLHKFWLRLGADVREEVWNKRGYHVMESHCWLILLHLWMFGIRPSSLLQLRKDNFVVTSAGLQKFSIVFP